MIDFSIRLAADNRLLTSADKTAKALSHRVVIGATCLHLRESTSVEKLSSSSQSSLSLSSTTALCDIRHEAKAQVPSTKYFEF